MKLLDEANELLEACEIAAKIDDRELNQLATLRKAMRLISKAAYTHVTSF
jgi:hypothetical protein